MPGTQKKVYTAETLVQVVHMQNLLAAHGVNAELRNARLGGAIGEIPFLETWPQLWVDDYAFQRASEVVERELHAPPSTASPWICPACGETIGGQFTDCWNCSAGATEAADDG